MVDAEGQTLGRLASKVARIIRGKHKPNFTPHADCGDNVIIINARKYNSQDKSGQKSLTYVTRVTQVDKKALTATELKDKNPRKRLKECYLKIHIGRQLFTNLKVYKGTEHNQEAQKPNSININTFK